MIFNNAPPWFNWALHDVGIRELPGRGSAKRIVEYRKIAHIALSGDDSVIPWCAIFVNAALEASGIRGTRSAAARSFINSRNFTKLTKPVLGCIVVLSSPRGSQYGHVGFYRGEDTTRVYLLGGNQNNAVSISPFPRNRVLGYYYPISVPLPIYSPIYIKLRGKEALDI